MRSGVKKSPSAFGIVGSNIYGERERHRERERERESSEETARKGIIYIGLYMGPYIAIRNCCT